jgi:hypothetical protein
MYGALVATRAPYVSAGPLLVAPRASGDVVTVLLHVPAQVNAKLNHEVKAERCWRCCFGFISGFQCSVL